MAHIKWTVIAWSADYDNLRAAGVARAEQEEGMRLVAALMWFWRLRRCTYR